MELRQIEGEVAKGCGIRDVALVVFIRKGIPEIQYLKASITGEQRREGVLAALIWDCASIVLI